MTFPFPMFVPLKGQPAVTYVASGGRETLGTTETWSSQSLGAAASDRYIVVGYYGLIQSAAPSCTVGGVSATLVTSDTSGSVTIALYIALVPTGTTGDIVFSGTAGNRHNFAAWRVTGLSSATPSATGTDTTLTGSQLDTTFTVPAGGVVIGYAATNLSGSSNITWTGVTEDVDGTSTNTRFGGASTVSVAGGSTTVTATYTGSTNGPKLITATWS